MITSRFVNYHDLGDNFDEKAKIFGPFLKRSHVNSSILQTPACDQYCDHNSHGGVLVLLMIIVVMIPMIVLLMMIMVMIPMIVVIISMIVVIVVIIVIKFNDNSQIICSGLAAVWQNKRTGLFQFLGEHNGRPVFVVIEFLDFPITNRHIFSCITFVFLLNFQFGLHFHSPAHNSRPLSIF